MRVLAGPPLRAWRPVRQQSPPQKLETTSEAPPEKAPPPSTAAGQYFDSGIGLERLERPRLAQGLRHLAVHDYRMALAPHSTQWGSEHGPLKTYSGLLRNPHATVHLERSDTPLFPATRALLEEPARVEARRIKVLQLYEEHLVPLVEDDRLPPYAGMTEYARFFEFVLEGDHGLTPDTAAERLAKIMKVEPKAGGADPIGRTPVKHALEDLDKIRPWVGPSEMDAAVDDLYRLMAYSSRRPGREQFEKLWKTRRAQCFSDERFQAIRSIYFQLQRALGSNAVADQALDLLELPVGDSTLEARAEVLSRLSGYSKRKDSRQILSDYPTLISHCLPGEAPKAALRRLELLDQSLPDSEKPRAMEAFVFLSEGVRQGAFPGIEPATRLLLERLLEGHSLDTATTLLRMGTALEPALTIERGEGQVRVGGIAVPVRSRRP